MSPDSAPGGARAEGTLAASRGFLLQFVLLLVLGLAGCVSGPERTWSPCRDTTCLTCRGYGDYRCPACAGRAVTRCTAFNCDRGLTQCSGCNGSGRVGKQTCWTCAGAGRSNCWTCGGRGEVGCSRCGGDGMAPCARGRWVTLSNQGAAPQPTAAPAPAQTTERAPEPATEAPPERKSDPFPAPANATVSARAAFCAECGGRLGESAKFCMACGAKLPR